ncbi:MAG: redoxin domain-containing protein [Gemmataceae bacterium]|nr:redoxin domain-containing protein [Gemmataceae bacterium]MCI0738623.1 redoxin domain-containing protein [Gemmataceae bacterium]
MNLSRTLFVCVSALLLVDPALSQDAKRASQAVLGEKVANLTFRDEQGKSHALHDLKNKKAIVIVFLSFECPVSNSYAQPLADMANEYGKYGVTFLGLTTNAEETAAQVAKHAKDFNVPFPVFQDAELAAAEALKAEVTPECFVLDGGFTLRYRGRIDDSYSDRLKKHPKVTKHNLRQVIGEVLSGRPVAEPATIAIGCSIPRAESAVAKTGAVTYYKDVLPILQNHCQTCHRPGEVGPFSLMTYRHAKNWAGDIKTYTQKRIMPPWKPAEGVAFHNERRLEQKEIDTLAAWVDGGTPEGDPKHAPPPRKFPEGWQLGKPDVVLTVDEEFTLGPTGSDLFRCFVLPTNLPEDHYVAAVELRPGNPRIVHHVLTFIDTTGQARKLEKAQKEKTPTLADDHPLESTFDRGPGYTVAMGVGFVPQGGLSGWVPGQMPRLLPEGYGFYLPKKADVVLQMHYHRNGRVEKDRTQIGLYFSKTKKNKPFQGHVIAGSSGLLRPFFMIPAGAERHHLGGDLWASGDFTLHAVTPHMHMIGKEIAVTMTPPDGPPQTLIAIKEWDYNWQETYMLKHPIAVKKGTRLHVDAYYDNSSKNPNNPSNPPRLVTFGEQTFNEMCFVFLGGTSNNVGRRLPLSLTAPKKEAAQE